MNNNLKILFFYRSKCAQSKKAFDHLKKLNFEITPIISEKKVRTYLMSLKAGKEIIFYVLGVYIS